MSPGWRNGCDVRPPDPTAISGLNLQFAPVDEDIIIPIAGMITGLVMVIGLPLVILYARKVWNRDHSSSTQSSPMNDHRLERIEQAIDAMAVEVERIAEGQRFVTKLLSDRGQERVAIPASQSRHEG